MHILPQLRRLEEKYSDVLSVIGIHSAKFMAERAESGVRNAIRRYEIHHPVANDADFRIWDSYTVRAWPTLYFVDPKGRIVGRHEGELDFETFDRIVGQMVREYDEQGWLNHQPMPFGSEGVPTGALAFPGKVHADEASETLYVADTNHNRILEADLLGEVRRVWGGGEVGMEDGPAADARFDHPQGMALHAGTLYLADLENHSVRALRLDSGTVETVAGTGEQAYSRTITNARAMEAQLSSPWDVCVINDVLYIAMAGLHQIWALDLASGLIRNFAGSGREGILDGPASRAELAQTSGLTTDGSLLYFADSETSSIRVADPSSGKVDTLVGIGLFDFGEEDGVGGQVRLQHPMDVCWHRGTLYVADSYNHKIKMLDPASRQCTSWVGSTESGFEDGSGAEARFNEPGGISAAGNKLYVADTNNHAVRVVDLQTGRVGTLDVAD